MSTEGERGRRSDRALVRQSGLTGVAAGIAVVFGLLLDISIAARFGAGRNTDAFFVAARIPLGLTAVVMVAANQALVPAFRTALTKRGDAATYRLISMIVAVVLAVGALLLLAVWLLAYPLMRITAPGISGSEVALAASMAPVVFAIVPLVTVSEVMRAYLNSRYRFVVPALMNGMLTGAAAAVVIGGPLAGWRHDIHMVAWAYLIGAALQVVVMVGMAVRRGLRLRPELDLRDPHLQGIGKLVVRPITGAGLNPVARLGEQVLVSFMPPGSITILNYGYRLISAIGGTIFFRSVIVALVPRLTEAHNRDEQEVVRHTTNLGLRIMLAISLPLTAIMAALAVPAAIGVYHRGSLSLASATLLGTVLAVYSISLIGSAVQRALLAPFFARLDTRTVFRNTIYGIVANIVLLPLLTLPFDLSNRETLLGVALAYSLAQYVNVAHAWYRLKQTIDWRPEGLAGFTARFAAGSAISAAAMVAASLVLGLDGHMGRITLLVLTGVVGLGGLAVLGISMFLLRGGDVLTAWRSLRRGRAAPVVARPATREAEAPSAQREAEIRGSADDEEGPGAGTAAQGEPAMSGGAV